jgi:hypothetical protein
LSRDDSDDLGRTIQGMRHTGAGLLAIEPREQVDAGRRHELLLQPVDRRDRPVVVFTVRPTDCLKRL